MQSMDVMTRLAYNWGERCFGFDHMKNLRVRSLRCAEEAIELAQCLEVDRVQMHKLVDMVYDRPSGEVFQELGGVLLTTSVLCHRLGKSVEEVFFIELTRCLGKAPEDFARRNQEKIKMGFR